MGALDRLKKGRKDLFAKVTKDLDDSNKKFEKEKDDRFWTLTVDKKTGTGAAIIRMLPPMHEEDELPWQRTFSYGFFRMKPDGKKLWYINESPATIGLPDPVAELNHEEWEAASSEAEKNKVRNRKRRTNFICNIEVIKDPANPDNNGKTFLYRYGKTIQDKVIAIAKPEVDELTGESPESIEVWDAWEGCNLRLKAKMKDNFLNYDDSKFEDPSELCGGDEDKMEAVLDACHKLAEFRDPKRFKSYEDLKKELDRWLGKTPSASKPTRTAVEEMDEEEEPAPKKEEKKRTPVRRKEESVDEDDETPAPKKDAKKEVVKKPKEETPDVDEDYEDAAYFKKLLAQED